MSSLARCPICKKNLTTCYIYVDGTWPKVMGCCEAWFRSELRWNQYAAAMELARAEVKLMHSISGGDYDNVEAAQEEFGSAENRVLEVFGGGL